MKVNINIISICLLVIAYSALKAQKIIIKNDFVSGDKKFRTVGSDNHSFRKNAFNILTANSCNYVVHIGCIKKSFKNGSDNVSNHQRIKQGLFNKFAQANLKLSFRVSKNIKLVISYL